MLNQMGLGFVFSASDLASGVIANLQRNFLRLDQSVGFGAQRLLASFRELGMGLSLMTAGAALVGGGFALANAAGEFEQNIATVGAVARATESEMVQLHDSAIAAGVATQFSPVEATLGLRELAQAGFNVQEATALLIPSLDLAAASFGELSPQAAAGLAAQGVKAFGLSADQASLAVDQMLAAAAQFAMSAGELPLGLGTAARGAQALNQSLSETLIAFGLVKNVVPGVERSSTAVAVSMERMADPKVQRALEGIGVSVVDSEDRFRDFLSILGDMAPELDRMTEAGRSAFLGKTFGREALTGVNAILTQLSTGVRTASGEFVRGAEAIAYFRSESEGAAGTAARLRERTLDTFRGQQQLLRGSIQTLGIVVGEPFTQIFKPIVAGVVQAVNVVLGVFQSMPAGVKRAFAVFTLALGGVLSLVGAAVAAKAGLVLLAFALNVVGVSVGGLVATLLPAVVGVGLLTLVVVGFVMAVRRNVGGLGDFVERVFGRVRLGFEAMVQLFSEGAFSGAVREELNRAENSGLSEFAIRVYVWANRIQHFVDRIGVGLSRGVDSARPSIESLLGSITLLGEALGVFVGRGDASSAAEQWRSFGRTGRDVGLSLAGVFEGVVVAMTAVVNVARGVLQGWRYVEAGARIVSIAVQQLDAKLRESVASFNGSSASAEQNAITWMTVGNVIAFVVGVVVGIIGVMVATISASVGIITAVIHGVIDVFAGLADQVTGVVLVIRGIFSGNWSDIWTGMKLIVFGQVSAVMGVLFELAGAVAAVADAIGGLFGKDLRLQSQIREFKEGMQNRMIDGFGIRGQTFQDASVAGPKSLALPSPPTSSAMPAAASVETLMSVQPPQMTVQAAPQAPITVQLQVDGQVLASVVHRADRDSATRSFSSVPTY